ncbi:MAG: hypothetical protein JJ926_12970 [Roseitalea sp.]|jgi:hypothetical protein|nr:hypothetical protein [Roseitalea sp.]MBO6953346.1 hypothetical protein [Rhizobiaceae bacterium]MBO6593693.1 hypothetical protein [Roseitalea sp.]MBO6601089.1 hypothetical protein [Roseitalea sp.]MBO6612770.1 hypothetical protein [Roseitalea sp.]
MKAGTGPLVWHEGTGYEIRAGSYADHATSTYTLAERAIADGRFGDAAELAQYTIREALEAFELFTQWTGEIPNYMLHHGVSADDLAEDEKRIGRLLACENGQPFDGAAGWDQYNRLITSTIEDCRAGRGEAAIANLERARNCWRDTHDRLCDGVYGWVDAAARRMGEAEIGALWDYLMAPMYAQYDRYDTDVSPWARSFDLLMQIALEGLRGHLSGPGRKGDLEVVEEADRWAIRFNPCGSGGRTLRDDPDTGTGPRVEPPFGFGVTSKPHDWSWNKTGICLYCVHCCALNERMPTRRFGYPTRVIDPPTWPEARTGTKCTWYVYKDPSLVPEEVYHRIGASKPDARGGRARANDHRRSTG